MASSRSRRRNSASSRQHASGVHEHACELLVDATIVECRSERARSKRAVAELHLDLRELRAAVLACHASK